MKIKVAFALAFTLCFTGLVAGHAEASNTYYVATTGSDANPGTETQPFRTLSYGVSMLTPRDTLYVKSGTYAEALLDNIPSGTSWSTPVTVAAAPGHTVTLKPNPGAGWVLHFQGQQYIVIDGLILDATNVTYDAVKITVGGRLGPAHHIRLIRSEVKNSPGQGVLITQFADSNEFINVNVHDNGTDGFSYGLYISTSQNVVEGSVIHNNSGYGVLIYNDSVGQRADSNIVRNNRIFDNGWVGGGAGIILSSGDGNTAYNNLVWNNYEGIRVAYGTPSDTKVYNNTVYNNFTYGIYVYGDSSNAIIQNNLFYANGLPEIQNNGSGTMLNNNLAGTNPLFVNAAAEDFHLQPGSPAIDAGIAVSSVTTDIAGTPRPKGTAYDIGAYEYVAATPSDVTPPSVSITAPANGSTVSGIVSVSASASDNVGVAGVQFKLDGVNLGLEDTVAPYAVSWDTTTAANASHTLTAVARDAAGNTAISSVMSVTVSNIVTYVATTGNDSVSCAQARNISTPKRTINNAVTCLTPGATLYVMGGTYAESLLDNIPAGTSWSSPVTVAAYPGHTVTLKPNAGATRVLHFHGSQRYIVIDGMILDGTNVTYDVVKITAGGGGTAHHIRLIRCEVAYAPQNGILTSQLGTDYNEFINLNVHNNGTTRHHHGIYISTSNNLVKGSTISNNYGYGVQVYDDTNPVNNNVVQGNNIYKNGILGQTGGIVLGSGDRNTTYNNLVWGNWYGIHLGYGGVAPTNNTAYNNTVYNNQAYGIFVESDMTGAIVRNNIAYANPRGDVANYGVGSLLDHNLMGIYPRFVNAAAGDFSLQPGSPAIDAGVTLGAVTTDILDAPRPKGAAYDIGAYELVP